MCMIALDKEEDMAVATSTSGLFYKREEELEISPVSGVPQGFYVNNEVGGQLQQDLVKI